uniref:Uncharacterized protein n=1 Tax=Anguilla anguilla TaxID=7936 RepID=A0A0E9XUF9_ANGAN
MKRTSYTYRTYFIFFHIVMPCRFNIYLIIIFTSFNFFTHSILCKYFLFM